jgi:transposase
MSIHLPDVDLDRIKNLKEAKKLIQHLIKAIEGLHIQNQQLLEKVRQREDEITQLKKRPKKPHFSTHNHSVAKRLKGIRKKWKKSSKKEKLEIDQDLALPEVKECDCGSRTFTTLRTIEKIVQGLIIRRNNICYHGRDKQCTVCGKMHNAPIPEDIKGYEFDSELRSWISFFKYECRMTYPILHDLLTGIGIRISTGQIANIIKDNSKKLIPSYTHLKVWGIKLAKYLHSDATGIKRKLKRSGTIINQHIHFVGHKLLSIFTVTRRYNADAVATLLGKRGMNKPYISDGASPNGQRLNVNEKQLCWWHEIGLYLKLEPVTSTNKKIVAEVLNQLWQLYKQTTRYARDPTSLRKKELIDAFDRIVEQRTGYDALDKRFRLTKKKKDRLLLFLKYPWLPIHNNEAERSIRKIVVIRNVSRETKSKYGDRALERHVSIMHTARKQGLDVFQTLHGLLTGTLSPFVLTTKTIA